MLKSVMYPVNEVQNIDDPAGIFGWVVVLGTFPTTFLGLPLGAKYKAVSAVEMFMEMHQ